MASGLLERLRQYSASVPKSIDIDRFALTQLFLEKSNAVPLPDSTGDVSGVTQNVPNGDLKDLVSKGSGFEPKGTPSQRLRAIERANAPHGK